MRDRACSLFFFLLCILLLCVFVSFLCIALDLGTRIHTHALRENFESTILVIQCGWHCFASRSETNLGFIWLLLFCVSDKSPVF